MGRIFSTTNSTGRINFSGTKKNDLTTSQGLYNLASQSGLKNQADRILSAQTGEDTKKIFSGGFISDIFDGLNALQYGVTGMLKGKSFAEGVKTRQSFSDKDALGDNGLPGVIAGIIMDIAVDPLTYIAPATIVKKIPFLTKALKGAKEATFGKMVKKGIEGTDKTYQALEGGTQAGKYLGSKFTWMFGADPIYKEAFERSVKNIAITTKAVADLGKSVGSLAPETASKLLTSKFVPELNGNRFFRTPLEELQKVLKPEEFEPVAKLYNKLDSLSKEAMDLGLLDKTVGEPNIGQYIKNAYEEYELGKGKGLFPSKIIGIKGIKERKEITKELTAIENPAYLLFKSVFDLTKDVENAKLLRAVEKQLGTGVAQEGFTKIATGAKWGALSGRYVPDNVATYLNEIIEPAKDTIAKDLVANFKFFKVVMNPATHARNIISNKILNYWKLGMNPLDPRVIKSDSIAIKEIFKGGGKWTKEATPLGYNLDTFASAEMKTLIDSPEAQLWGKGKKFWKETKEKLGNIYQGEENHAKLSAYIFNRTSKGLSPEDAWKASESATFNYAQVTPFVRKLRESLFGFPFITFTFKATPVAVETILKNPQRVSVLGKIKNGIEQMADIKETARERASEPPWVKDGFYIKLPIKDKNGRSAYFDMTYILPFGDIVSGNFFSRGTDRESGLPESRVQGLAENSPFIQTISAVAKNENFYGNKIWKESDTSEKQLKDLMIYLTKTYAPPLVGDQLPNGYNRDGQLDWRGFVGASKASQDNQKRNITQELLRTVGAKIQPVDADIQETYVEWNKRKALENLLRENNVGEYFNRFYIPKE